MSNLLYGTRLGSRKPLFWNKQATVDCVKEQFVQRLPGTQQISMMKPSLAGETAKSSGLYRAVHDRDHVPAHYVVVKRGDVFPNCLDCANKVRFEIAVAVPHANEAPHFIRSSGQTPK